MPHKRSPESLEKRLIRKLILRNAFHDKHRCEIVSTFSRVAVLNLLPVSAVHLVPSIENGEVLVDSRGQGSFQRGPPVS